MTEIQLPKSIPDIFDVALDENKIILTIDFNDLKAWNRVQEILEETNIPQHLYVEVRKSLPSHEGFVSDGTLDTDSFCAVVSTEITDWQLQLTKQKT